MTGHVIRGPWRRNAVTPTADAHAWAERIRASLATDSHCADPADIYTSEYRRWAGLAPVHRCRLRELARRQLAEHQADTRQETAP